MKINITKNALQKALSAVSKAVSTKPTIEVVKNIAIEAKEGTVRFTSTDLEIAISTEAGADVQELGATTVSAKSFIEFISLVKEDEIHLELEDNQLKVKTVKTKSKFPTIPYEEFPQIQKISTKNKVWAKIPSELLVNILDKTTFSADRGSRQPVFSGVLLHQDNPDVDSDMIHVVATDGLRLSKFSLDPEEKIEKDDSKFIVPYTYMDILAKLVYDTDEEFVEVYLISNENQVLFKAGRIEMSSNLLDDAYPDYKGIIPDSIISTYNINVSELIDAVKLSNVFFNKLEGSRIRFEKEQNTTTMLLKTSSADFGEYETSLNVNVMVENEDLNTDFAPKHLLDILSRIKTENVIVNIVNHPRNEHKLMILNEEDNPNFMHLLTSLSSV